jgi:osmotically-inducible protein OsmY
MVPAEMLRHREGASMDRQLRQSVIDELDFEPSINATHIGVAVEDGVVTLTGYVPSFLERCQVERVVRRVKGVRGIVQDLEVRHAGGKAASDDELARRALAVLEWDAFIPQGAVQVVVQHGWITLTGEVSWQYQRQAAEESVRRLQGVTSITNNIALLPRASAPDVRARIEKALQRHAHVEATGVRVTVENRKVTLEGTVDSLSEREAAENAAWSAPGVQYVEDRLKIGS